MKKQSMKSRFKEHAGEEREMHGYHKPKSKMKSMMKFEEKEMKMKKMKKKKGKC